MASYKNLTEQELILAFCNNQTYAMDELVMRTKNKLYTSIMFIVKDDYLAEDIMQDTYLKAIDSIRENKFVNDGKFLPWLCRIAHNLCMDYYRKNKKMPTITLPDGRDIFEVLQFEDTQSVGKLEKTTSKQRLLNLLSKLPIEQREVLVLRLYANLSFAEIAKQTHTNINTTLGRMRYGLLTLRKIISDKQLVL